MASIREVTDALAATKHKSMIRIIRVAKELLLLHQSGWKL